MNEKISAIQNQLKSIEEELTDIAFQELSRVLSENALGESAMGEDKKGENKNSREALEAAKQLEKSLVKARRAIEKARESLNAVPGTQENSDSSQTEL